MGKKFEHPTIKEKIKIYTKAIEILENETARNYNGICHAISRSQKKLNMVVGIYTTIRWSKKVRMWSFSSDIEKGNYFEENFPELLEYKPSDKYVGGYWWTNDSDGNLRRIKVLHEIIEKLTKEQRSNKLIKFFNKLQLILNK